MSADCATTTQMIFAPSGSYPYDVRITCSGRILWIGFCGVQGVIKAVVIATVIAIIIAIFSDAFDFILIFNSNFIYVVLRIAMY